MMLPSLLLAYTYLVSFNFSQLVHSSPNQWKNIFILAGQSNMAGRGGVINDTWDGIHPPECRLSAPILKLTRNLTWECAHEPLHMGIDLKKPCGIGPGMAFANAVLKKMDVDVKVLGLVPCAVGGTSISEWQRGTRLYKKLVRRAEAALVDGGVIRAMLWYQGESDTVNYKDALLYKAKLERFISDLRVDLQSPLLPVFQVALASGPGPYIETVRDAQLGINLVNVMCVDAQGLGPLEPDHLHLSTRAQVRLGTLLAESFLQFLPGPGPISSHACPRLPNFIFDLFRYMYLLVICIWIFHIQFYNSLL